MQKGIRLIFLRRKRVNENFRDMKSRICQEQKKTHQTIKSAGRKEETDPDPEPEAGNGTINLNLKARERRNVVPFSLSSPSQITVRSKLMGVSRIE